MGDRELARQVAGDVDRPCNPQTKVKLFKRELSKDDW